MAGAPIGNQNAVSKKPWTDAIYRALEKRGHSRLEALDALAEKLLSKCDESDLTALKELGDRIEGKPTQTLAGDPEAPLAVLVGWNEPSE